jgi:hypothetical protein
MKEQNYANHGRYVPMHHFITSAAILAIIIGSFVNLFHASHENLYSASLICRGSFVMASLWWYLRAFALKAQDRAIRAEENFRHFILTGKPLPSGLRMSQVIALRFASDEEFPSLVQKALDEKMGSKRIKEAIQQWRADHHRV